MDKVTIRGFKREQFTQDEIENGKQTKLELKGSYQFSSSRGISETHEIKFEENDMLEFVFDDNTTWTGSPDIIHDIFPETAKQKRAIGQSFEIPMYLKTDDANRGLFGDIALKVLNVFTKKAVTSKVMDIAANLEKKVLSNMSGVYNIHPDFSLSKATVKKSDNPYLLFIHGTNSSTSGSFAEIQGSELWQHMQNAYGLNILGLQHETMTKSPLQNVIGLLKELPDTCTLHIITHSRGGLVGDVLARFCNDNDGFTSTEIAYLEKTQRSKDIADIKTLQKIAASKRIVIDKFIRVACPAYGTTILSKRLDHFLNISMNLIGLAMGPAGKIITGELKNLLAAAVDVKNDPNELPGLEAMNPDSPFLKVLNNPANSINGSLTVISGNCGMKLNLKALLIIASKLFYMRDNDLVVDTKSMYCGSKRNIPIQYFFDEGPEVDHVHYFKNKKTQDALLYAIRSTTASIPNFSSYEQSVEATLSRNALLKLDGGEVFSDKVTGKKPIVILLPGIMGSNLEKDGNKVWINYFRFLAGELARLDIAKQNIEATSLIKTSYKKLVDHLKDEDYDVVTFPFDWRLPLANAAALLKDNIEKYLALKQPIKIIGHSMGGVVTRDLIVNHPAIWKKLNASKDFKLLLLGAPLGGSYRIPYVLAGKDSIINQLSKIDLVHTKKELLDMFRKFPGLLGLLPIAKQPNDFADIKTWQAMKAASAFDWNIPEAKDLQFFGAYRDKVLQQMGSIEMKNVVYIAGKDDATVCGFEINNDLPGEKIVFKSTAEGDQSVTWDTGIPKQINKDEGLYFANVSHGALANEPDIFNGISEILKTGRTDLLNKIRPSLRGGAGIFDAVEEETYDTGELNLEDSLMGIKAKKTEDKKGRVPVKVRVSNGDLFYRKYPILVGHFLNDGITSAEKVIDNYTGNQLSQRHRLNMYPGDINTNEVFLNFKEEFSGAVVIGLGEPGRLSAYQLTQTVESGAVKYMLELKKISKTASAGYLPAETGISVLLIGGGYGGLSIDSSVRAIVQGIQNANAKIEEINNDSIKAIRQIEFVELYEDRCLQCLYVLSKMETEEDSSVSVRLPRKQIKKLPGFRTRIPVEDESDWWSRISVEVHKEKEEEDTTGETALRFSCSTGRAREEQRDLQTSPDIINDMIEEMSTDNQWNRQLAKSFFELLIPNDFKDEIKKQSNTLWVLDTASAAYPWELLQDSINNSRPLCCNAGMIRQLQTKEYRLKANDVIEKKALVIGDPDLNGYPYARQLPGAFKEAKMVASLLDEYQYEMPNNCFNRSSKQIINALFGDDYKIIHLAGHGVFNKKNPKSSGMLIGNGIFLSSKEICQMSKVPELVFVNCCFLGNIDPRAEELMSSRYKLAANIGTQLIRNGVKVVIAAGWAVDDTAALYFTGVFYKEMLGGSNFGDAVKEARSRTFRMYPDTNTWGAYQCYGDPFFKLRDIKKAAPDKPYLIEEEAEIDLSNLINKADTKWSTVKSLEAEILRITSKVDAAGLRNAAITEKEAMAYAECNNYEQAISAFEKLLSMEQAGFSVRALEKYCNIRAKLCVKNWQSGIEKNKQVPIMDKVIKDLKQLIELSPTAERYTLMGSAYKRKAMITSDVKKKTALLADAAYYYQLAYHMSGSASKIYLLTGWLDIENILVLAKKNKWGGVTAKRYKLPTIRSAKEEIESLMKIGPDEDSNIDFWSEIRNADASRCLWLLEGSNTARLTEAMVVENYTRVWNVAGSQSKKIGELEHLDFLKDAYAGLVKSPKVVKIINKIKNDLKNYLK